MTDDESANSSNLSSHPLSGLIDIYIVQRVHFGIRETAELRSVNSSGIAHLRNCDRGPAVDSVAVESV